MNKELRTKRDEAAARHDAALAMYPSRDGEPFRVALRYVIEDLEAVVAAAERERGDPTEIAKALRWLGDAWFDLGMGRDQGALSRGAAAYERAESFLRENVSPVEKAKLDFSYANTLRGLSDGTDLGLMEAALTRYEQSRRVFTANQLGDLAGTVEQNMKTLEPQLRLAKQFQVLRGEQDKVKHVAARLGSDSRPPAVKVSEAIEHARSAMRLPSIQDALDEALAAWRAQVGDAGTSSTANEQLGVLEQQIERLRKQMSEMQKDDSVPAGDPVLKAFLGQIWGRFRAQEANGTVTPERGRSIQRTLEKLTELVERDDHDMAAALAILAELGQLWPDVGDWVFSPSHQSAAPDSGSGAARAAGILRGLLTYLVAAKMRPMTPSEEAAQATALLSRAFTLAADARQAAVTGEVTTELENETWRLAAAVHTYARRHNLALVNPQFADTAVHAPARTVFTSGGLSVAAICKEIAQHEGWTILDAPSLGDISQERWSQLNSSTIAVFDLRHATGGAGAQVCYELGLALAVGKPSLVLTREDQTMPFNISRSTVLALSRTTERNALRDGIEATLATVPQTDLEPGLRAPFDAALDWLEARYATVTTELAQVPLGEARRNLDDAAVFARWIQVLIGMLGPGAPRAFFPAWPADYPRVGEEPTLFHVMPFAPAWATPSRNAVAETCEASGWAYTRGDENDAQRIIPGIWSSLSRSSAVLIDLTGQNLNVALELGLVHVLGRPYAVVAQDDPKREFPAVHRLQIRQYESSGNFPDLRATVRKLCRSAIP